MTNDGSAARGAQGPPAVSATAVSNVISERIGIGSHSALVAVILPALVVLRCHFSIQAVRGETFRGQGKRKMLTTASIWGITVALGVAAAAWGASDRRHQDESLLLAQACAGLPSTRQVEDALSTMRAMSNGGFDPICTTIASQSTSRDPNPKVADLKH